MILSVVEYVVRRGLKEEEDFIIGVGKLKKDEKTNMKNDLSSLLHSPNYKNDS